MPLKEMIDCIEMFDQFSEKEKNRFVKMDHYLESFKRGDTILKEGDDSSVVYLLIKGAALVTRQSDNAQIRLAKLGPGDIFGNMSFISEKPRKSNIVANEDLLVLRMDNDFFDNLNPVFRDKIKNYFIELLIQRLDAMNDSMIKLSNLIRNR
jgi:serine/threonine-protein kinase